MPSPLCRCSPAGGRSLRLCVSRCAAAGLRPQAGAWSAGGCRCSHNNHSSRHSSRSYRHLAQGPLLRFRPHQPQQPLAAPQRRVYQTTTTTTTTASGLHSTLASPISNPPTLSLADLHIPSALFFSTSSSSRNSSSSSTSSTSSFCSHPLLPSFSRKYRRRLARWLPAIMVTQVHTRSDDSADAADAQTHTHTHSHGLGHHHHHHDNVYLTSQNKKDAGVRITRIGLYSNLGMAFAKGAGGYFFNSQSMVADAWHSMTDLASDILTLATVSWSLRPPTDRFPAGFGKVESLGSLGVSSMLLGGGVFMCMNSLQTLYAHFFLDAAAAAEMLAHAHGHSHGHSHGFVEGEGPSIHAAWLAAGTVLVKEWLYRATMKVAREHKSTVLASNAIHHRVDSLTGIVTLAAILGANFIHDAAWLDPVGGLLISLMVIRAGWANTTSALYELADRSIDDDVKRSVRRQVAKALADQIVVPDGQQHLLELRDVSGIKSGQNYLVDLEVAVPSDWTVETVRTIEDTLRTRVGGSVRGVRRVRVRFVKLDETTVMFDEFVLGESPRGSPEPEEHGHDHDHDHDHSHTNGNHKH